MEFSLAKKDPTAAPAVKSTREADHTILHELFQTGFSVRRDLYDIALMHHFLTVFAKFAVQLASNVLHHLLIKWLLKSVILEYPHAFHQLLVRLPVRFSFRRGTEVCFADGAYVYL